MTIEFNCPRCGAVIAFDSRHCGKRAKCLTCGEKFIIPSESFKKPEKVEPESEPKRGPLPGFYRAVFLDTWKLFVDPKNVTTLVFVIAVVCFNFFLADSCCVQYLAPIVVWGWLFGFYGNVIAETALGDDVLPEIDIGTSLTFLWYIIWPLIVFSYTAILAELPFFIGLWLVHGTGVTIENFREGVGVIQAVLHLLLIFGLFLFPSAILATAVGRDLTLLRPSYIFGPIFHAFGPYVTTFLLLTTACFLQFRMIVHVSPSIWITVLHLAMNLGVQVVAIFAMRSIGLFYRHYSCYFEW